MSSSFDLGFRVFARPIIRLVEIDAGERWD